MGAQGRKERGPHEMRPLQLGQSSPPNRIRDRGVAAPAGALDMAAGDGAVFSLLSSPTRSGIQGLCFFLSLRRERHWILVD